MKTTVSLVACLGLMLVAPSALAAAKFYKWTDAQGVTHYSADPPPESARNTSQIKVPTRLPGDREAEGETPKASAKADKKDASGKETKKDDKSAGEKPEAAGGPERYAEKCKKLRGDLQTMQEHARIKVTDEKGETRVLSEEEKNTQVDDIQRQVKAYCE